MKRLSPGFLWGLGIGILVMSIVNLSHVTIRHDGVSPVAWYLAGVVVGGILMWQAVQARH